MNVHFPYQFDGQGRTASPGEDEHIRQLIEQVLFTAVGERVNRPEFGSGILQLVFAPASDELATASQFLVQSALQQYLGELITVEAVDVQNNDSQLVVDVQYMIRRNGRRHVAQFRREAT